MTSLLRKDGAEAGVAKHSMLLGAAAVVAVIVAIYLWQQLRNERQMSEAARRSALPAPDVGPVSPTPPVVIAPVDTVMAPAERPDPTASPSVVPPSPLREFERMFRNARPDRDYSMIAALHSAMEREGRDAAWAFAREAELRALYASKSELAVYNIPTIECRSTMCEVRLVAGGGSEEDLLKALKGPGATPTEDGTRPKLVLTSMDSQNGTTAVVIHVSYGPLPAGLPPPTAGGRGRGAPP